MKRLHRSIVTIVVAAVAFGALGATASAAVGSELLFNPGLESVGSGGMPNYWTGSAWGSDPTTFKFTSPTGGAHGGDLSVRVDVTSYVDGDGKWVPSMVSVTGGAYYRFSDWYKSNTTTAMSVYYETATDPVDGGHWANLFSGIPPSSDWTQYATGFTMPAGAVRAYFVHFIAGNGYLQTDDYSMKEESAPPGFSRPMISLTFDDGSEAFYTNALPLLEARSFKTTQYIPTLGLNEPLDAFMMTKEQIRSMYQDGHEIGSHSVTHPDMTKITPAQLRTELVDSKAQLEAITGVAGSVVGFAYPFGTYDANVIQAAEDAGYVSGRSVEEGYNARPDTEPYDIRVQNMEGSTTLSEFQSWVDYAKAHNYWLVIVYHEVVPDTAPPCTDPETIDPCLGPYDTTISQFTSQLAYIASQGLGSDVKTVSQAFSIAANHSPADGTVKIAPASPATDTTLTAEPKGFTDADGDQLTYHYRWLVNGVAASGATDQAFDLSASGHGDRGDQVSVEVYATDAHGGTSSTISDTITVGNSTPSKGGVAISPTSPVPGAALTASPSGFADADADALRYSYSWFLNGQRVGGDSDTYALSGGQAGDVVRVEVLADDGHAGVSDAAAATVILAAGGGVDTNPTPTRPPSLKPDKSAPTIVIKSPKHGRYRLGIRLPVRFSCTDTSGVAQCKAVLVHGRSVRTVRQGTRVRLSGAGRYVLRITATDKRGNRTTKSVSFSVR